MGQFFKQTFAIAPHSVLNVVVDEVEFFLGEAMVLDEDAICSRSFTLDIQISSKDKPEVYLCIEGTVVFLLLLLKSSKVER